MANYRKMSAADLVELAERIEFVSNGFRSVAEQMKNRRIAAINVKGIDTTEQVLIPRLTGNLSSAMRSLAQANAKADE